jgi:Right handed beta helix region
MSTTTSARRTSISALAALAAALLTAGARADVLHVPGDFPTVAEALAAAQPGDEVVLAAGSYNDPILMQTKVGITLRGQGKVVLGGGDMVTPTLELDNCSDVTVDHLRIEGAGGTGVLVDDCDNITLSRVRIKAVGNHGIAVGDESDDILLDRCRVEGALGNGISFEESSSCTVWRCTVAVVGGFGIALSDVFDCRVERCKVENTGFVGIALGADGPANSCVALDNRVTDPGTDGLSLGGTDGLLAGNRVKLAGTAGINIAATTTGGIVQDNRMTDCDLGLRSQGSGVLIRDNRIVGSVQEGVLLGEGVCVLEGNLVIKSALDAYRFEEDMDGSLILDNRAKQAGEDGFDVSCNLLAVTGNSSMGAGAIGFQVIGADCVLTENSAHGSGNLDLENLGAGNVYLDNDFGTSQ